MPKDAEHPAPPVAAARCVTHESGNKGLLIRVRVRAVVVLRPARPDYRFFFRRGFVLCCSRKTSSGNAEALKSFLPVTLTT